MVGWAADGSRLAAVRARCRRLAASARCLDRPPGRCGALAPAWAARAEPLGVIQVSMAGTSLRQVPMLCPSPRVSTSGTSVWRSWSSCQKVSALAMSSLLAVPAPSQKDGITVPGGSTWSSCSGVFAACAVRLPPNGLTTR